MNPALRFNRRERGGWREARKVTIKGQNKEGKKTENERKISQNNNPIPAERFVV